MPDHVDRFVAAQASFQSLATKVAIAGVALVVVLRAQLKLSLTLKLGVVETGVSYDLIVGYALILGPPLMAIATAIICARWFSLHAMRRALAKDGAALAPSDRELVGVAGETAAGFALVLRTAGGCFGAFWFFLVPSLTTCFAVSTLFEARMLLQEQTVASADTRAKCDAAKGKWHKERELCFEKVDTEAKCKALNGEWLKTDDGKSASQPSQAAAGECYVRIVTAASLDWWPLYDGDRLAFSRAKPGPGMPWIYPKWQPWTYAVLAFAALGLALVAAWQSIAGIAPPAKEKAPAPPAPSPPGDDATKPGAAPVVQASAPPP